MHGIVRDYLLYCGYGSTLRSLDASTRSDEKQVHLSTSDPNAGDDKGLSYCSLACGPHIIQKLKVGGKKVEIMTTVDSGKQNPSHVGSSKITTNFSNIREFSLHNKSSRETDSAMDLISGSMEIGSPSVSDVLSHQQKDAYLATANVSVAKPNSTSESERNQDDEDEGSHRLKTDRLMFSLGKPASLRSLLIRSASFPPGRTVRMQGAADKPNMDFLSRLLTSGETSRLDTNAPMHDESATSGEGARARGRHSEDMFISVLGLDSDERYGRYGTCGRTTQRWMVDDLRPLSEKLRAVDMASLVTAAVDQCNVKDATDARSDDRRIAMLCSRMLLGDVYDFSGTINYRKQETTYFTQNEAWQKTSNSSIQSNSAADVSMTSQDDEDQSMAEQEPESLSASTGLEGTVGFSGTTLADMFEFYSELLPSHTPPVIRMNRDAAWRQRFRRGARGQRGAVAGSTASSMSSPQRLSQRQTKSSSELLSQECHSTARPRDASQFTSLLSTVLPGFPTHENKSDGGVLERREGDSEVESVLWSTLPFRSSLRDMVLQVV